MRKFKILSAALCALSCSLAFAEQPSQGAIVKGQGTYALVQLKVFSAFLGSDPVGDPSREALENGWAPVDRRYASPSQGWPARGPSLGESIEPLLAQAKAAQLSCPSLKGDCQASAMQWAKQSVGKIKKARNPGAELSKVVAEFE